MLNARHGLDLQTRIQCCLLKDPTGGWLGTGIQPASWVLYGDGHMLVGTNIPEGDLWDHTYPRSLIADGKPPDSTRLHFFFSFTEGRVL